MPRDLHRASYNNDCAEREPKHLAVPHKDSHRDAAPRSIAQLEHLPEALRAVRLAGVVRRGLHHGDRRPPRKRGPPASPSFEPPTGLDRSHNAAHVHPLVDGLIEQGLDAHQLQP